MNDHQYYIREFVSGREVHVSMTNPISVGDIIDLHHPEMLGDHKVIEVRHRVRDAKGFRSTVRHEASTATVRKV